MGELDHFYFSMPWFTTPLFIAAMFLESEVLDGKAGLKGYLQDDTRVSLWMWFWNFVARVLGMGATAALFAWVYQFSFFTLSPYAPWTWIPLFFLEDLCFYWQHRASHRVRLLWASHVNHHSSEYFNFGTALRQTALPYGVYIFWLPLCLIGFHPMAIAIASAVNLCYQFFLHTEAVGRLGVLERFMNTPSHHRVHHGANLQYADKNFGGWLIVWDKLFGTYQPLLADVPVRYGLTHNIGTFAIWRVAFHEWIFMLRQVRSAATIREKLGWLLQPPDWGDRTAAAGSPLESGRDCPG